MGSHLESRNKRPNLTGHSQSRVSRPNIKNVPRAYSLVKKNLDTAKVEAARVFSINFCIPSGDQSVGDNKCINLAGPSSADGLFKVFLGIPITLQ